MKVKCLNTVYLDGKKYEPADGEWEWPDDRAERAMELCTLGYLELVTPKADEDEKPKGKRGA